MEDEKQKLSYDEFKETVHELEENIKKTITETKLPFEVVGCALSLVITDIFADEIKRDATTKQFVENTIAMMLKTVRNKINVHSYDIRGA